VAIATLTGSVVARNRSILTRATLPAALLALSAHHFLPKTTHNVRTYAGELEDKYAPGLAHIHDTGRAHTAMAIARAKESFGEGYTTAERTLAQTLGRVQETTGLKVKDASAWGQQTVDEAATRAGGVLEKVKEQAATAEGVAKDKTFQLANKVQDTVAKAEKEVERGMDSVAKKVEEPPKRLV
jgi:organizing structure protein 2